MSVSNTMPERKLEQYKQMLMVKNQQNKEHFIDDLFLAVRELVDSYEKSFFTESEERALAFAKALYEEHIDLFKELMTDKKALQKFNELLSSELKNRTLSPKEIDEEFNNIRESIINTVRLYGNKIKKEISKDIGKVNSSFYANLKNSTDTNIEDESSKDIQIDEKTNDLINKDLSKYSTSFADNIFKFVNQNFLKTNNSLSEKISNISNAIKKNTFGLSDMISFGLSKKNKLILESNKQTNEQSKDLVPPALENKKDKKKPSFLSKILNVIDKDDPLIQANKNLNFVLDVLSSKNSNILLNKKSNETPNEPKNVENKNTEEDSKNKDPGKSSIFAKIKERLSSALSKKLKPIKFFKKKPSILDKFSKIFNMILNFVARVFARADKIIKKALGKYAILIPIIKALLKIYAIANKLFSKATGVIKKAAKGGLMLFLASPAGAYMLGYVIGKVVKFVKKIVVPVKKYVGIVVKVWKFWFNIFKWIFKILGWLLAPTLWVAKKITWPLLKPILKFTWEITKIFCSVAWTIIWEALKFIWSLSKFLIITIWKILTFSFGGIVSGLWNLGKQWAGAVWKSAKALWNGAKAYGKAALEGAKKLWEGIKNVGANIKEGVKKAKEFGKKALNWLTFGHAFKEKSEFSDAIQKLIDDGQLFNFKFGISMSIFNKAEGQYPVSISSRSVTLGKASSKEINSLLESVDVAEKIHNSLVDQIMSDGEEKDNKANEEAVADASGANVDSNEKNKDLNDIDKKLKDKEGKETDPSKNSLMINIFKNLFKLHFIVNETLKRNYNIIDSLKTIVSKVLKSASLVFKFFSKTLQLSKKILIHSKVFRFIIKRAIKKIYQGVITLKNLMFKFKSIVFFNAFNMLITLESALSNKIIKDYHIIEFYKINKIALDLLQTSLEKSIVNKKEIFKSIIGDTAKKFKGSKIYDMLSSILNKLIFKMFSSKIFSKSVSDFINQNLNSLNDIVKQMFLSSNLSKIVKGNSKLYDIIKLQFKIIFKLIRYFKKIKNVLLNMFSTINYLSINLFVIKKIVDDVKKLFLNESGDNNEDVIKQAIDIKNIVNEISISDAEDRINSVKSKLIASAKTIYGIHKNISKIQDNSINDATNFVNDIEKENNNEIQIMNAIDLLSKILNASKMNSSKNNEDNSHHEYANTTNIEYSIE